MELNKAFQKDLDMYSCLDNLDPTWKVTAYSLQQLVVFLTGMSLTKNRPT